MLVAPDDEARLNRERVISILEALANGIRPDDVMWNPRTFDSPEAIRALFTAARMLREANDSTDKRNQPAAAGAKWSANEETALCAAYDKGVSIENLAAKHRRTRSAITIRLIRLGRIEQPLIGTEAPQNE